MLSDILNIFNKGVDKIKKICKVRVLESRGRYDVNQGTEK